MPRTEGGIEMTGLRSISLALAALLAAGGAASAEVPDGPAIDAAVARLMRDTGARGLAVAVVDDGRVAYVQAYGARNAAGDPLTPDTIMYGASLTKTVFAYSVLQLADQGVVDLDRPVAEVLPDLPTMYDEHIADYWSDWRGLADDPRWRTITPRISLTHSTGFSNFYWDEPDQRLRIHFDPGTRYAYSGDGLILIQFMVERGLGRDYGQVLQSGVFDPLGMTNTSLKWRPDFATNLADGWKADGSPEPHDDRSKVRVAGSMDTTIADMGRFAAALIRGDGLSAASRADMVRPQLPITTASQFPSLQPELPPERRRTDFQAGLGVVTFAGPQGPGFFKGGHNDSTGNTLVCVERGRRCVVILSNDVRSEPGFAGLVAFILGETGVPYDWEYGPQG
jgi:CubicO group peptidase (beta-lactamase class C family)